MLRSGERVCLVIVNYGSVELVDDGFGPLSGAEGIDIVVVDNRSTHDEAARVDALCRANGWHACIQPDNRGFGAATNAGLALAEDLGHEVFVVINPDARITADVARSLARQVYADPFALVSPRVVDREGRIVFDGIEVALDNGQMHRRGTAARPALEWIGGACMAFGSELLHRTGGFNEDYFLYWEDVDFSIRAAAAGARMEVRSDLVVHHDEGGTQHRKGPAKSATYYRYNCRNRLRFAADHLQRTELARWVLATPAQSWQILLRGGRRQLVHDPRLGLAAARGSLEGIVFALAALTKGPRR